MEVSNINLKSLFQHNLGGNIHMKFWHDSWCGSDSLGSRFPRLAALDLNPECLIHERLMQMADGLKFCGNWRRNIREGREAREVTAIENMCKNLSISRDDDGWKWSLTSSGEFTVASLRRALDDMMLRRAGLEMPWIREIPIKLRIRIWQARLDRLLTKENLAKRGIVTDDTRCPLCNEADETSDHLFINCRKASAVRRAVNRWWDLLPTQATTMAEFCNDLGKADQLGGFTLYKEIIGHAFI